ncbi:aromatic amino acid lyase, partial [Actinoalloteichus caeruleus]
MSAHAIAVGPGPLTAAEVLAVARAGAPVRLTPEARDLVVESRERVRGLAAEPRAVYGVSTGFGALATRHIPADRR